MPHWLLAKIPVAGLLANAAPPKFKMELPVAVVEPPMLLFTSPRSKAVAVVANPINTTPALPPLIVLEMIVLFEFVPAAEVGVNAAAAEDKVFKIAIPIVPLCQGARPAALFTLLNESVQFLMVLN